MAVAELDEPTLAREDLRRELAAVFPGHGALHAFDDGGDRRAVILKLLSAVDHPHAGATALVFVEGALVRVLEATPARDVIDKQSFEVDALALDVVDQPLQGFPACDVEPALTFVGVGSDDIHAVDSRVGGDSVRLVFSGVALMVRGHPNVLGCADARCRQSANGFCDLDRSGHKARSSASHFQPTRNPTYCWRPRKRDPVAQLAFAFGGTEAASRADSLESS